MNLVAGPVLRVGDWRVDPTSWEISRGGVSVRVEARTMGLLLCLAEHGGKVVSIQQLLDQVWSGVVVTQDSVYQAVASLRRVLGDDARRPCYIETVPRLGYRLVADVSPWIEFPVKPGVATPGLTGATSRVSDSAQRPRRQVTRVQRSTAVVLASGAAFCLALLSAAVFRGAVAPTLNGLVAMDAWQQSVAVLPLLDLTPQRPNDESPADGMTEELIDRLSRIRGIRVPPPTCPSYIKDKQLGDIAKSLNVAYVLDGSVRTSESNVRVALRLVRVNDGHVVWSETYDRPQASRLMMQDDIASQVAKVLRESVT